MQNDQYQLRLKQVADHVRNLGHHPVYVCLYGSQNYGLDIISDEYTSDMDYKCVVLPNLEQLVKNSTPVSVVVPYQDGQIDIKDIRCYMETLLKCNPAYVETIYTPYFFSCDEGISLFQNIRSKRDALINEMGCVFTKAICGMFSEKKKAMCHPYPTTAHKIEKFGYDGKQVHHMYRLLLMLYDFDEFGCMYLKPSCYEDAKELLIDLKLNRYPLDVAQILVGEFEEEIKILRTKLEERYSHVQPKIKQQLLSLSQEAVFDYCITEEGRKKSE